MTEYYDDNFGHWEGMDLGDPDAEERRLHYHRTQDISVEKECRGCEQIVRLKPDYAYCNSCMVSMGHP